MNYGVAILYGGVILSCPRGAACVPLAPRVCHWLRQCSLAPPAAQLWALAELVAHRRIGNSNRTFQNGCAAISYSVGCPAARIICFVLHGGVVIHRVA